MHTVYCSGYITRGYRVVPGGGRYLMVPGGGTWSVYVQLYRVWVLYWPVFPPGYWPGTCLCVLAWVPAGTGPGAAKSLARDSIRVPTEASRVLPTWNDPGTHLPFVGPIVPGQLSLWHILADIGNVFQPDTVISFAAGLSLTVTFQK